MSNPHPHEPGHNEDAPDEATVPVQDAPLTNDAAAAADSDAGHEHWAPHAYPASNPVDPGEYATDYPADRSRDDDDDDADAGVLPVADRENTVPLSEQDRIDAGVQRHTVAENSAPEPVSEYAETAVLDQRLVNQPTAPEREPDESTTHAHEPTGSVSDDSIANTPDGDPTGPDTPDSEPLSVEQPLSTPSTANGTAEPVSVDAASRSDAAADADASRAVQPEYQDASARDQEDGPVGASADVAAPSSAVALSPDAIRNQYVIQSPEKAAELARTATLEPAHVSSTEPVLATADPGAADTTFASPPQQVVYVEAPAKPKKKGNRGVGSLIAALSGIAYGILFAAVIFILYYATTGRAITNFLGQTSFFVPVILFVVAFIVLVLIANRAGWWAYALGSIVVGVFVYFATTGVLLLLDGVIQLTPQQATVAFARALTNPLVIASGLLAREIALWVGLAISARGRRVKARNQKALADYDREIGARRAGYGRTAEDPVAVV